MSEQQNADYELAFNELHHELQKHGISKAFWDSCDAVEARLIAQYPRDEPAIVEMVATWLARLGISDEDELRGFI